MGKTTAGKPNRHKVERVIKETEAAGQQQRRRRYTRCSPQSGRRRSTPQTNCTRNGTDDKGRNFKSGKMGCRQPDNNLGKRYKSTAALFQRQSGWNVRMGARGEHASGGGGRRGGGLADNDDPVPRHERRLLRMRLFPAYTGEPRAP